jgi:hypothetical protein
VKIKVYRTKILPVASCGCGSWSLALREDHTLRVIENSVLRKMFGPKRQKVAGGWSKLHNEGLHNLYSSNIFGVIKSRKLRWA